MLKPSISRFLTFSRKLVLGVTALLLLAAPNVYAISQNDYNSIVNNTPFYDPTASQCSFSSSNAASVNPNTAAATWNSGLQPPYYLEEYVSNILKDLAQVKGIPTTDTVTQEHVVALIAWTYAEGGNIANTGSDFNIWNMGVLRSYPQLFVGGGGNSNGTQTAFVSFDAGVEGNTIAITGSNQNRIGAILSQPSSTAEEVMHAIAYYNETPGNLAWAWGPQPNDPAQVLNFNHTTYIKSLLDQLNQARSNYTQEATVVLGPGEENTHHVDPGLLQFNGGTSNGSGTSVTNSNGCITTGSVNCQAAVGNAKILCEALPYNGIYYRWGGGHNGYNNFITACPDPTNPPNNQPHGSPADPTDNNQSGNPSPCATDCSGLVSIAVDAAFNQTFMWSVGTLESDTSNWKSIDPTTVQAGDVLVVGTDHIEIVDHYDAASGRVYTFGSHATGKTTGQIDTALSYWTGAYRYIGPGSGGN